MSAWSTNGRHNAIVADGLAVFAIIEPTREAVEEAYAKLAAANERSLNARYGDNLEEQAATRYGYVPGGEVTPGQLLGLAHSWVYQSCEHATFVDSEEHRMVAALIDAIVDRHDLDFDRLRPEDTAWSIASLEESDNSVWLKATLS